MEMESGGFNESQLEGRPKPSNDKAREPVQQKEGVTNRQYGTPYCLRPRLQPQTS